jgi:acyl-CoA thioesterase II
VTSVVSVWDKYPGYAIDILPWSGVGRATVAGTPVATSSRCLLVRESEHLDQLYVPRQDVIDSLIVESDHHTICPFKGEASYGHVSAAGTLLENAMWWYPDPLPEVSALAGYVAFYTDQIDVTLSLPLDEDDEATVRFPLWGTAQDLAELMDVAPPG